MKLNFTTSRKQRTHMWSFSRFADSVAHGRLNHWPHYSADHLFAVYLAVQYLRWPVGSPIRYAGGNECIFLTDLLCPVCARFLVIHTAPDSAINIWLFMSDFFSSFWSVKWPQNCVQINCTRALDSCGKVER